MSAFEELPETARVASQPAAPPAGGEAIFELMRTMRAMRRLKPDPVPRALLEQLVAAATWAPSASNGQAYSYLIVTDRRQMARLAVLWRKVADFYLLADAVALTAPHEGTYACPHLVVRNRLDDVTVRAGVEEPCYRLKIRPPRINENRSLRSASTKLL